MFRMPFRGRSGADDTQTPRKRARLSLEAMESRLLLSAGVVTATHEYDDGTRITLYDTDPSDGVTVPDVAWNRSEYVRGETDVYVVKGAVDGVVSGVYLLGDGSDTDDVGVVVENNALLNTFRDLRAATAGPVGFVASEGNVGIAVYIRGAAGADLNGQTFEGGWTLPADLDNDGDTADRTGFLSGGDTIGVYYVGGTEADTVIYGDARVLMSRGEIAGDLYVTGDVTVAKIVNFNGVGISGDTTIGGSVTSFTSYGHVTGDLTVDGGNLIHIIGKTTGDVTITDDIRVMVFKNDVISTVKIDGDNIFFWLYNGRLIDGDGDPATPALEVTGNMNCFKAWGHRGSDPTVQGNVHVRGDIPNSFIVFGDMSGRVRVDGNAAAVYVFGGRLFAGNEDPLTPIFDIGGNVDLIKIFGYRGDEPDVIDGNISVGGRMGTFYMDGGNFDGTLQGGSINKALYNTPDGVTGNVQTTTGDLNYLRTYQGGVSGSVNSAGGIGTLLSMAGVSGSIDSGSFFRSLLSYGTVSGDVNVGNGNLSSVTVKNPGGAALDGANLNVLNGNLGAVNATGDVLNSNFNASGAIEDALVTGNFSGSNFNGATPNGAVVKGQVGSVQNGYEIIDAASYNMLLAPGRSGFPDTSSSSNPVAQLASTILGDGWLSGYFDSWAPSDWFDDWDFGDLFDDWDFGDWF